MNWDQIEGNWMQLKGRVKQQWGELTDDDLDVIDGSRDVLCGMIQEAYGISRDEAELQLDDWQDMQDEEPLNKSFSYDSQLDVIRNRLDS